MKGMNGRYYMGRMIMAEYSPVTDFREAKCRQYKEGTCERGGFCNFMHPKPVNRDLKKHLYKWMYDSNPKYREDRRKRKEEEEENGGNESPAERPKERERERRRSRSRSQEKDRHHRVDRDRREGREDRIRGRDDDRGDRDRDRDRRRSDRGTRDRRDDRHRRDDDDKDKRRRDHDRDRRDRSPRRHRSRSRDRVTPSKTTGEGDMGKRVVRMSSEERRAMIAGWAVADEVIAAPKDETITKQEIPAESKPEVVVSQEPE